MRMGKDFEVIGVLGLRRTNEDECVAAIELDGDVGELSPDVMCPALETYITILENILNHYESMYLASSQGDPFPDASEMN